MMVTHKINMDLLARDSMPRVDAVQDDRYSRNLEISLYSGNAVWTVPAGVKVMVRYRKPDGTGGEYDILPDGTEACGVSGNVITAALAPQVCTVPGTVQLAVGLILGEAEINTFSIRVDVQEKPGLSVISEDYYNMAGVVKASGWEPNHCLGTDENGRIGVVRELDNLEYLTIIHSHQPEYGFSMAAGNPVLFEDGSAANAVAEFYGSYGDEPVALRGLADGVHPSDAVTVRQLQKTVPGALPNPNPLTINGISYDGSAAVDMTILSSQPKDPVLVASATCQEDASEILITKDHSDQPLNVVNFCIFIVSGGDAGDTNSLETPQIRFTTTGTGIPLTRSLSSAGCLTVVQKVSKYVEKESGSVMGLQGMVCWTNQLGDGGTSVISVPYGSIDRVYLLAPTGGYIPAGTTIEVWDMG